MTLLTDRVGPATVVRDAPFPLLIATDVLDRSAEASLGADFPQYRGAGFFPYASSDCGASMNTLIAELTAPAFADQVGDLLGIERLSQYPVLVTICRALNLRHGTMHTDSRSKVASALVYLNPDWAPTHAGCLRFHERAAGSYRHFGQPAGGPAGGAPGLYRTRRPAQDRA